MKQNELITIFIPTHNRPSYLKRILAYYSEYQVACNMIVTDSSPDEIKKVNGETVLSFSNLKVQHINYPTEINPFLKIADAVERVNTKYCVFCADDDFVTPNGINQSVDFLENNTDFSVAHGRYISFHLEDNERGEQQFCWKHAYSRESITFSDPKDRLSYHLSSYLIPTFYAVHRTEHLKMIYEETRKTGLIKISPLSELVRSMLSLIYGKMQCLDVLYAARDEDSTRLVDWPDLTDAIKTGAYDEEYAKVRDLLSIHLSQQTQRDIKESMKLIDDAMSAYVKKYYFSSSKMASLTTNMGHTLDHLRLPDWLDGGIRGMYKRLFALGSIKRDNVEPSLSLEVNDDLNMIRHYVLGSSRVMTK